MKSVAKFVSGSSNVLCEIGARKEVVESNNLWMKKIIDMNSCGMVAALEIREENLFKNVENG